MIFKEFSEYFRIAFSKIKAGRTGLISSDYSLKISRTPYNHLMPGGDKRSYIYI